jgi:hypothetical protein
MVRTPARGEARQQAREDLRRHECVAERAMAIALRHPEQGGELIEPELGRLRIERGGQQLGVEEARRLPALAESAGLPQQDREVEADALADQHRVAAKRVECRFHVGEARRVRHPSHR